MAFSPFRTFRKHQKAFFAGLTIVCMLTFVLAGSMSRGGDFFSWVGTLIGGSREPKVAVLYGKPIYRAEMVQLRNQRQLVHQYMELLTSRAEQNFSNKFEQTFSRLDDATRSSIQTILFKKGNWRPASQARREPEKQRREYLGQLSDKINRLRNLEEYLIQNKKDAEQIDELRERLQQEFWQIQRVQDAKELFFGGTLKFDDLIAFMIWKHEADRRGIQLSMTDVQNLIHRETGNSVSQGDLREIGTFLRDRHPNVNPESLREGLADEFRVRIVKAALLGEEWPSGTPATPYQFWQFYRDRRTENQIAVLPIPVRQKDFLDQVGQPKEEELKTLYDQGKDTEYDPASDKPGFKVPPRIGVEWVSARADSDHYRKAAETVLAALQATLPLAYEAALSRQFDDESYKYQVPSWTDDRFLLHDSSVNRTENVAALVGQLAAGGAQPQAFSGYTNYVGTATAREVQDRLRIGLSLALSRSSPTPFGPAALAYYSTPKAEFLPMSGLRNQLVEKVREKTARDLMTRSIGDFANELRIQSNKRPEDVVPSENLNRPEVVASMVGALTTGSTMGRPQVTAPLLIGTPVALRNVQVLSQLGADMFLSGAQSSPFSVAGLVYREQHRNDDALRRTIDTAVAKFSFQHGSSQKLRSRFDIAEDEGLKPLKDSYDRFRANQGNAPQDFASLFWSSNPFLQLRSPYSPQQWPQVEVDFSSRDMNRINQQFQDNLRIWNTTERPFLYWKTEDKPAYVPTLNEAKDKVVAWWKFDKARQLAEKEAEQVMAEAKGKPDAERRLKDGSKHSERWFYLSDQNGDEKVAKLVKPWVRDPDQMQWQPFKFSKSQIEYPPTDVVDKLIAMTEPGEVLVFHDRPKTTYYVAALVNHGVPSTWLFYREYELGPGPLLGELEESTHYRRELEKNLLAQLREESRFIEVDRNLVEERSRSDEE